jgi:hypothetical protein
VKSILGKADIEAPIHPIWGAQVGSKGAWVYNDAGVVVRWHSLTEMWWAVPGYTPPSARVADVGYFVPKPGDPWAAVCWLTGAVMQHQPAP